MNTEDHFTITLAPPAVSQFDRPNANKREKAETRGRRFEKSSRSRAQPATIPPRNYRMGRLAHRKAVKRGIFRYFGKRRSLLYGTSIIVDGLRLKTPHLGQ